MSNRHEAYLRHADYYVDVLRKANDLYLQGGGRFQHGLDLFDSNWDNIRAAQAWSSKLTQDMEAIRLCSAFGGAATDCLDLRLSPSERIPWMQASLVSASQLGDEKARTGALGNLGTAYAALGELERAK